MSERDTDTLIVGGGISGCAAAQELHGRGVPWLLLEANAELGGLTRSIAIGSEHFDYTGHFLHLSRYRTPAAIPHAQLDDSDWSCVSRRAYVYVAGQIIPAPFQYNLAYLEPAARSRCVRSYQGRPCVSAPGSFKEYLTAGFGEEICELFLYPYNEKLQRADLETLAPEAGGRFFPAPDAGRIERGAQARSDGPQLAYNARFWYPTHQGIGLLAAGLARGLDAVWRCAPLERLDLAGHRAYTPRGPVRYSRLLSSIPLKRLCCLTEDAELHELGARLQHSRTACINLVAEGRLPAELRDAHWVYLPGRELPFYRVGFYSNVIPGAVADGKVSLYAEAGFEGAAPPLGIRGVTQSMIQALDRLGWIDAELISVIAANWIECAYVNFLKDTIAVVGEIRERLQQYDVAGIGRYGRWDYLSMEESIAQAIAVAQEAA